jgi:citrate lyase subunit beta / citryl-CoA lyase
MTPKLLRSCLFTPADRVKALNKAYAMTTLDCIVVDMEDATAALDDVKLSGRKNVMDFILETGGGASPSSGKHPGIVVRVNDPLSTPWGREDIDALCSLSTPPSAIVLPKAQNAREVEMIGKNLPSSTRLWVMIETAQAVQNVDDIASVAKVETLVFGSNDFSKDIGATLTQRREPLLYAMGRTICAAKSNQKTVIDGVFMNLTDGAQMEADLRSQCQQGKEMGFDGKSLIHPKQVEIVNNVWAPNPEAIDHASRVIACYTEAMQQGKGVAVLDGKLIEALHVDQAKALLLMAHAIEAKNGA